jgi:hypothetical protein
LTRSQRCIEKLGKNWGKIEQAAVLLAKNTEKRQNSI